MRALAGLERRVALRRLIPKSWFGRTVLFVVVLALLTYGVSYGIWAAGGKYSQLPAKEIQKR